MIAHAHCNHKKCEKNEKHPHGRCPSYMVPPALAEVGQLVFQGVLQHLKHDAQNCAQPPVPQYQGLKTIPSTINRQLPMANNLIIYCIGKLLNMLFPPPPLYIYCACVCVWGGVRGGEQVHVYLPYKVFTVCVWVSVCACICVCACVHASFVLFCFLRF